MECAEGALNSSFRQEMAVKTTANNKQQQMSFDNFLTVNGHAQGGFLVDDFFVDDFLDLSTGFAEDKEEEENKEHENDDNDKGCSVFVSVAATAQQQQQQQQQVKAEKNSSFSEFGSLPSSELSVPADDLADLEWLSHFVDDSFPEYSLTYPAAKSASVPLESRPETKVPVEANPCFTTPVQTKARSKRTRTGGRVWSLSSPSLTESSTSSSSSMSSNTSPLSSQANSWLIYTGPSQTAESFIGKPPVKKQKKKKQGTEESGVVGSGSGGGAQPPRRCSHCGVQKTPQWRAGPLGAKTLCNACGVRYKSGRLLPEYRPACSPTFSSEFHSNNHRKVLEMRRKKEVEAGLAPPVQSF